MSFHIHFSFRDNAVSSENEEGMKAFLEKER
jgi:hypothetical protein